MFSNLQTPKNFAQRQHQKLLIIAVDMWWHFVFLIWDDNSPDVMSRVLVSVFFIIKENWNAKKMFSVIKMNHESSGEGRRRQMKNPRRILIKEERLSDDADPQAHNLWWNAIGADLQRAEERPTAVRPWKTPKRSMTIAWRWSVKFSIESRFLWRCAIAANWLLMEPNCIVFQLWNLTTISVIASINCDNFIATAVNYRRKVQRNSSSAASKIFIMQTISCL